MKVIKRLFSMKWNKGFTLLEVVASLAIVGTVFVVLISFVVHQLRIAGLIRDYTYAVTIADEELAFRQLENQFENFKRPQFLFQEEDEYRKKFEANISDTGIAYIPVEISEDISMPECTVSWEENKFFLVTYLRVKR